MELLKTLTELCAQRGVSGDEKTASEKAAQLLSEYADVSTDPFGNVCGTVGAHDDSKQTLLPNTTSANIRPSHPPKK